ncbi:T9SS type A sorting domain-containing protein [Marinirhabdus gelatinilytica]|uniref:Putative secreted protein (Por secretion system target) n=1 Tax=Marinirhabdus gelatinilytica TaxID=1703343 RepID=A0A370QJ11_9FLAO|nr:T9SS type A sorting domain-containing protein [Marinirhabdus gelatinilytica]RDK88319.1 putative secreted protein (Por secretion system target) [Marinirhabdus gelatinilytica]
MKKLLHFVFATFFCSTLFSQSQGFWYLTHYLDSNGNVRPLTFVDPYITSTIEIDANTNFTGTAACNTFIGTVSYNPTTFNYTLTSFTHTNTICEHPSHLVFEDDYFSYFNNAIGDEISVIRLWDDNFEYVEIDFGNNKLYQYRDSPLEILNTEKFNSKIFKIVVNQNLKQLLIFSNAEDLIDSFVILNASGQTLIQETGRKSSIDVSTLTSGVYFLKVLSKENTLLKKFIIL